MSKESKYEYKISETVLFQRSKDSFGEFSNMHMGFPFLINDIKISCVESIYQALKFSEYPLIQMEILKQKSPMMAKFKSRKYQEFVRSDWDLIKVSVMEFLVKIKIYNHRDYFHDLFIQTGEKKIAEYSTVDTFWAMKQINSEIVIGSNILGEIIMKIREELMTNDGIIDKCEFRCSSKLYFFGHEISRVKIQKINHEIQLCFELEK